jgi:hypothetical protein
MANRVAERMTHPVTGARLPPLFFKFAAKWNNTSDPLSRIFFSPQQRQEKTLQQNGENTTTKGRKVIPENCLWLLPLRSRSVKLLRAGRP